jgi:hypothetical protein
VNEEDFGDMDEQDLKRCTAFEGSRSIASGNLLEVARRVKEVIDRGSEESILIFDDSTSEIIEVDFRGKVKDVMKRLGQPRIESAESSQRGPGRPKLGVVSREVTLLPRHWDWLNSQPGGASVALRKLVEEAKRVNRDRDKVRRAQEAAYRFMSAMAGNLPGFEEAARALFAGDSGRFSGLVASWPVDVRDHTRRLSEAVFQKEPAAEQ